MFTLGFDVAKDRIDIALINKSGRCKERHQVSNNVLAITKLVQRIQLKHSKLQVGCEATGFYHLASLRACAKAQVCCYVLNPLITKQYTKSTIRGRKTDRDDAVSIARLVLRGEGSLTVLDKQSLAQVYVRLATKVQQQKQALGLQERFYLELRVYLLIRHSHRVLMPRSSLWQYFGTWPANWFDDRAASLLQSIPGIGPLISTTLLAEIGSIDRFPGPKQLVAFSGLDPRVRQSGNILNRHTKLTKRGAPELRRVLFLAANIARQRDSELIAYYQKKRSEGKSYTVATVATARKLCYRIYAVLNRGTPYIKST